MGRLRLLIIIAASIAVAGVVAIWINKLYSQPLNLGITRRSLRTDLSDNDAPLLPKPFPRNYHATGKLFLPHGNIMEPFEVWYAGDYNRSRIDYYFGNDKTYQRGDLGPYGTTFKVVPMYTDKKGNYQGCWHLRGTKHHPIIPQPAVPNMTDFKFDSKEVYMGTSTTKWDFRYMAYGLLNTHSIWTTRTDPTRPVRYEMKGYDSLLASYYDHYILEYISFEEWKPDLSVFELPKDQWCYNWSRTLDTHLVTNPMQEFLSYGDEDIEMDDMYKSYKEYHNKNYDSHHEHMRRKHIFRHSMRYIRSINRKHLNFKLAPNHMADMRESEWDRHKGQEEETTTNHTGSVLLQAHHEKKYSNMSQILKSVDVPEELDWRDYGAVTSVRGQGICGSCYAIAACGAVEGAYFMRTGTLPELSAQQVIDCSWGSGNHGCRGGYYTKALSWIYLHGVATAKSYGQYLGQEGTCHFDGTHRGAMIDAFAHVPKNNNTALKIAVAKYGPAAVSINVNPLSLKFYSWGIYDDPECDNSSTQHSMLVVGYGQEKGIPYWLVKNSWSTSWGIDGFIKIAWRNNTCGVTNKPVVALMHHTSFHFPVKEKIKYVNPSDPDSMGRKIPAQPRPRSHGSKHDTLPHPYLHNYAQVAPAGKNKDKTERKTGRKEFAPLKNKVNLTPKRSISRPDITARHTFVSKIQPHQRTLVTSSSRLKNSGGKRAQVLRTARKSNNKLKHSANVVSTRRKRKILVKTNKLIMQFLAENNN